MSPFHIACVPRIRLSACHLEDASSLASVSPVALSPRDGNLDRFSGGALDDRELLRVVKLIGTIQNPTSIHTIQVHCLYETYELSFQDSDMTQLDNGQWSKLDLCLVERADVTREDDLAYTDDFSSDDEDKHIDHDL